VNGKVYYLPYKDVIQFKNGIDPCNTRKGLSPLAAAMREIFTGTEVANFSATLLRNMGVISYMLSPKEGGGVLEDTQALALKAQFEMSMMGENRGRAVVNTIPV